MTKKDEKLTDVYTANKSTILALASPSVMGSLRASPPASRLPPPELLHRPSSSPSPSPSSPSSPSPSTPRPRSPICASVHAYTHRLGALLPSRLRSSPPRPLYPHPLVLVLVPLWALRTREPPHGYRRPTHLAPFAGGNLTAVMAHAAHVEERITSAMAQTIRRLRGSHERQRGYIMMVAPASVEEARAKGGERGKSGGSRGRRAVSTASSPLTVSLSFAPTPIRTLASALSSLPHSPSHHIRPRGGYGWGMGMGC
ncbi:hypothetical protein B0H12DRAFT_1234665 [Mycena haematopus]|nr:hypothetical protein B0H12DRAFT_1234665 [Mycena haematopus]